MLIIIVVAVVMILCMAAAVFGMLLLWAMADAQLLTPEVSPMDYGIQYMNPEIVNERADAATKRLSNNE